MWISIVLRVLDECKKKMTNSRETVQFHRHWIVLTTSSESRFVRFFVRSIWIFWIKDFLEATKWAIIFFKKNCLAKNSTIWITLTWIVGCRSAWKINPTVSWIMRVGIEAGMAADLIWIRGSSGGCRSRCCCRFYCLKILLLLSWLIRCQ